MKFHQTKSRMNFVPRDVNKVRECKRFQLPAIYEIPRKLTKPLLLIAFSVTGYSSIFALLKGA